MCSMNPLQFSFQRIQQLLVQVSKLTHSSTLPGQPFKFPNPPLQSVQADISHLISCHGYELECYYLKCLFSHALEMTRDERNVLRLISEDGLGYLLKLHLCSVYRRANCVSLLSNSLQQAYSQLFSPGLATTQVERNALSSLNKALKQSLLHTCVLSLSLLPSPLPEVRAQAEDLIQSSLPLLISHFVSGDISRHEWQQDATTELLHLLLSYMLQTPEMESCVTSQEVSDFIQSLQKDFHTNQILPLVLSPLIYPHSADISLATLIESSTPLPRVSAGGELAGLVLELGYGCLETKEDVMLLLQQFPPSELTSSCVARVIGAMASHHKDLSDQVSLFPGLGLAGDRGGKEGGQGEDTAAHTWTLEPFLSALKDLAPSLNWREVVLALDNSNFFLPDPDSLSFVMRAYKLATQDPFPVEVLYRSWENKRGHLSWLRQALSGCAEFSFADYHMRRISVEQTKYPPEDETKNILTWTSLDLIETLLALAEGGLYEQVLPLFNYPLKHCSEILLIGLVQAMSQWNVIQLEVLSGIVPTIISTHPASHAILSTAWHDPSVRAQTLMMSAISEWYTRSPEPYDQSRLTRILEIAQDMKTLVNLLNTGHPFSFAVELACLACRRDYLKLDIWLVEKVKLFRDFFVCSCVNFLKQRVPTPQAADKIPHLNQDIVHTILSSLTSYTTSLSQDTSDTLQQLLQLFGPIPVRLRPHSISLGKQDTPYPPGTPLDLSGQSPYPGTPLDLSGLGLQPTPGGVPQNQVYPGTPLSLPPTPSSPLKTPGMQGMYRNVIHGMGQTHQNPLMFPGSGTPDPSSPYGMMGRAGLPGAQTSLQSINTSRFSARQPPPEQSVIEKKANQYFQKLYVKTLTVEMFLSKLKGFKDSTSPEDRSLFQCILKNMFDEYHYFSHFPEKELEITGQLFGGLINEALLCVSDLEQALKCVLDALKKPLESKMFHFGIAALYKFITRIKENPQYCHHIAAIQHFQAFPPIIIEFVQYGKNQEHPPTPFSFLPPDGMGREMQPGQRHAPGILPPVTPGTQLTEIQTILQPAPAPDLSVAQPIPAPLGQQVGTHPQTPGTGVGKKEPSLSNPPKIDTLLSAADQGEERPQGPSADIQDKVHFIFNNLSASNLTLKTDDFRKLVQMEHFPWAARYLVMQRASTEMNLHNLYMSFLDAFHDTAFNQSVLKETYRNIKVILRSDKNLTNIADRTLLKSLGHWLGLQTLAKNRPVLHADLAVKELVLEAYHKGMQDLLYVVPFVSKVLESCAESRVFKPPNPWVTGIMRVLSELHAIPDLKLNLKFEIEVLCKNLSLEIAEVEPAQLLEDKHRGLRLCQLGRQEQMEEVARPHPVMDTTELKPTTYDPSVQQPDPKTPFFEPPTPATGPQHPAIYQYHAISTILPNMSSLVNINPRIALFQAYPQLMPHVWGAIEQAIKDLIRPVADRAMKIALTTAEHIVKKDFALDHDETRMRAAAHHMVKHMAAGMALITCRDPLLITISKHLLAAFKGRLGTESAPLMEQAASQVANDNTELACAFIQKTVVEQVSQEIDKKLSEEFELRSASRQQGRRYCNTEVLTYHAQRMPEQISLKPGPALQQQIAVYEEFGRCLPGFHPMAPPQRKDTLMHSRHSEVILNSQDLVYLLSQCTHEVETLLHIANQSPYSPLVTCLKHLLDTLNKAQLVRNQQIIFTLIREALEGLFKALNFQMDSDILIRFRDVYLFVLRCLQECKALGVNFVALHVTLALLDQRPDHRYYLPIIDLLARLHMIDMREIDAFVAKEIERGDTSAVQFGAHLVKHFLLTNKRDPMFTESDLGKTLQALTRLTYSSPSPPDLLINILEAVKHHGPLPTHSNTSAGLGHVQTTDPVLSSQQELYGQSGGVGGLPGHILSDLDPGLLAAHLPQTPGPPDLSAPHVNPLSRMQLPQTPSQQHGALEDPPGLAEKVELLLSEWVRSYHHPMLVKDMDQIYFMFMNKLQQQGIMTNGDLITRFFRISVEMCVSLCYKSMNEPDNQRLARAKCYHTMDAFVKLVAVLVRFTGDTTNIPPKVNVLQNVITTVTQVLLQDHQSRGMEFHQLPYQRFFIMLLTELSARDPAFEPMSQHVLTIYSQVYHELRPAKAPGFAYAWLELVSHRIFIEKVLIQTPQPKGWHHLQLLLVDLFSFLSPFLRNADLERPLQTLYKGTLRVLLVLLHDFPEFLCDHHFVFCNVIPPNCIQMRNLILSAFPRNLRLPDPFTPDLKFEELPEIAQSPRILGDYLVLIPSEFKAQLDAFLLAESVDKTFPAKLKEVLQSTATHPDNYNIPLLNALILYIGQSGILGLQETGAISSQSVQASAHFSLLRGLVSEVDTKGRYLLLNAVTNQLRYPNSDTHYFSVVLLALFLRAQSEMVQEQITRVLLERLIVYRPHPWGLLVTFIELIKGEEYNFWEHRFVHCAPEIERLFESVAQSCTQQKQAHQQTGAREEGELVS